MKKQPFLNEVRINFKADALVLSILFYIHTKYMYIQFNFASSFYKVIRHRLTFQLESMCWQYNANSKTRIEFSVT